MTFWALQMAPQMRRLNANFAPNRCARTVSSEELSISMASRSSDVLGIRDGDNHSRLVRNHNAINVKSGVRNLGTAKSTIDNVYAWKIFRQALPEGDRRTADEKDRALSWRVLPVRCFKLRNFALPLVGDSGLRVNDSRRHRSQQNR